MDIHYMIRGPLALVRILIREYSKSNQISLVIVHINIINIEWGEEEYDDIRSMNK